MHFPPEWRLCGKIGQAEQRDDAWILKLGTDTQERDGILLNVITPLQKYLNHGITGVAATDINVWPKAKNLERIIFTKVNL